MLQFTRATGHLLAGLVFLLVALATMLVKATYFPLVTFGFFWPVTIVFMLAGLINFLIGTRLSR